MVVVLALIACMGFCIYKKCLNKDKKAKKVRERKGGRGRRKKDKDGEDGEEKKVKTKKFLSFLLIMIFLKTLDYSFKGRSKNATGDIRISTCLTPQAAVRAALFVSERNHSCPQLFGSYPG